MEKFKYDRNLQVGQVGFNAMTQTELVQLIEDIPLSGGSAYVVFCGVPGVVLADSSREIADSQNNATLCAMDGMPIARIARKKGIVSERCGGPDIMLKVIERGLAKGKRHYFYGSTPETLRKLERNLKERFPEICIAGRFSPPFRDLTPEEDGEIVKLINDTHPDYVWVGLGAPKQDFWMQSHREALQNCVLLGVGAAFDFHSEKIRRAPQWMRDTGLEWLYRLLREPARLWKRYLVNGPKFLFVRMSDKRKERRERRRARNERRMREKTAKSAEK